MSKTIDFNTGKQNREEKLQKEMDELLNREEQRLQKLEEAGNEYDRKVKNGEKITYSEVDNILDLMFGGGEDQKRMTEINNKLNNENELVESLEERLERLLTE